MVCPRFIWGVCAENKKITLSINEHCNSLPLSGISVRFPDFSILNRLTERGPLCLNPM